MRTPIVQTKHLSKVYRSGDVAVQALDDVDFSVQPGSFTAIIGKSGCGKSTLLHLLGGLDTPTSGEVIVDGNDLHTMNRTQLALFRRRRVGFIFQQFNLIPDLTVYDNVIFPLALDGTAIDDAFIATLLERLHLADKRDAMPAQLSGGEQQRVAIARALVNNPRMIIADEPTGNLDPVRSLELMLLLEKINELGTTVLVVTHEKELVDAFSKRVISIDAGRVISDGLDGYYGYEAE